MRQSAFNHLTALPEGGFALYNFLTGTCLRLNVLSRDHYDNFDLYGEDCEQVRRLVNLGFLVDCDEHAYLRNRVRLECGDTSVLSLTICPTLQCNFACPYCYAEGGTRHTDELGAQDFLRITREAIEASFEGVVIVGGEPLVYREFERYVDGLGSIDKKGCSLVLRTSFGFNVSDDLMARICAAFERSW